MPSIGSALSLRGGAGAEVVAVGLGGGCSFSRPAEEQSSESCGLKSSGGRARVGPGRGGSAPAVGRGAELVRWRRVPSPESSSEGSVGSALGGAQGAAGPAEDVKACASARIGSWRENRSCGRSWRAGRRSLCGPGRGVGAACRRSLVRGRSGRTCRRSPREIIEHPGAPRGKRGSGADGDGLSLAHREPVAGARRLPPRQGKRRGAIIAGIPEPRR